jgi:hypothetical protein
LPRVVDIRQMHISWKQGIHKLSDTLLDSKKLIWCCPIILQLGQWTMFTQIPLYQHSFDSFDLNTNFFQSCGKLYGNF